MFRVFAGPVTRSAGLVHLGDAIEDLDRDLARGKYNPLAATGTSRDDAAGRARQLHAEITAAPSDVAMIDRELADALFGPVLTKTVRRREPVQLKETAQIPAPHAPLATARAGLSAVTLLGIFGGPPRRRGFGRARYDPGYDPRYDPGYSHRANRRGPSCCDLLACDCCANAACGDCCGGDCCLCCV